MLPEERLEGGIRALLFSVVLIGLPISFDVLLYPLAAVRGGDLSPMSGVFFLTPRLRHELVVTGRGQRGRFLNS